MRILFILFFSTHVFASDNYATSEGRKIFVGPSLKVWCSLTKKGIGKVGSKHRVKTVNLLLFPKTGGTGHLPSLVAKDLENEGQVSAVFKNLTGFCSEEMKVLPEFINKQLKTWRTDKVALISIRAFDEILWDYYDGRYKQDKKENACQIRKVLNVKNKWVITYPELNKACL